MSRWFGKLSPGFTIRLNLLADFIALVAATLFSSKLPHGSSPGAALNALLGFAAVAGLTWAVVSTALRHYDPSALDRGAGDDAALVTVLVMASGTCVALFDFTFSSLGVMPHPGHFISILWPIVVGVRLLIIRPLSATEDPLEDVLVIGTGPMARLTGQDLMLRGRRRVVGYLSFPNETEKDRALLRSALHLTAPVMGTSEDMESVLRKTPVEEVYIAGNALAQSPDMQRAISVCERMGLPFALPAYSFRLERAWPPLSNRDGYLHCTPYEVKPLQMALKRLFDIICSAAALWVLTPLLLVVILLIKTTSRGPVIFRQRRVGLRGKPFNMPKFRSMVANADQLKAKLLAQNEQAGPVFKMRFDPRVTWIGRLIRRYSIDELPQLINVLRGEMSIVGPRPPVPDEVARYEPWQLRRLSVRPGLTCIWQVSGRNQIAFDEWMYLDMQYIDHWSFSRDVGLIFKTLPAVLSGKGAS